jgi:hypothetical protein
MDKIGKTQKSRTQQSLDGELGLIIDEMGRAMWNANKTAIANGLPLTGNMSLALAKFQDYCMRYYAEKNQDA